MILVDVDMIHRVLINLLENAIKFTPVRGRIAIGGRLESAEWVRLWVRDTGPGVESGDSSPYGARARPLNTGRILIDLECRADPSVPEIHTVPENQRKFFRSAVKTVQQTRRADTPDEERPAGIFRKGGDETFIQCGGI